MNTPPTLNVGQSIRVGNSGYQIIKELGYGAFGRCYMVKNISTEYCYACKVMHLPSPTSRVLWKNLDNEVFILNLLRNCSNISKFISYHTDDKYTYIILGLYENNSLKEVIGEQGRLSEDQARVYLLQTLSGLFNCHKNKVLHRDIKPGNVLLNHKMEAILSDFGLAIILNSENQQVKGRCGTRYYMAPEVASGNSYGFSADIWSLGVMLLTLVVGYLPFCNSNDKNIYQKVKTNKFKFPHNIKLSEEFKDIVSKMLNLNPEERPTIAQIQDHPFF
ncbi:Pkinase-domain-containing protein, partial [Conidiobolus coronatus NRRL 28638]